jgi:acetylornithine deacetylase/succinyl-diaminopimelate desuccinylase-like protein
MTWPNASTPSRLKEVFDTEQALALLRRAIAIRSVTGEEAAFAGLLANELRGIAAGNVTLRDFAPGRPSVWGFAKASLTPTCRF